MKLNVIIFIVVYCIVLSCENDSQLREDNSPKEEFLVTYHHDEFENHFDRAKIEPFILTDSIWFNDTLICFNTYCLNDSLSDIETWEKLRWPIIKKQDAIIFNQGKRIGIIEFNFEKKTRLNNALKPTICSKYVIRRICLFQSNKKIVFSVPEAQDLCVGNYCSTYQGLFELSGKNIYSYFRTPNLGDYSIDQKLINHLNDTLFAQKANKNRLELIKKYQLNFRDTLRCKCFDVLF